MAEDTTGEAIIRGLQALTPQLLAGLALALEEEAKRILEASQPLVPVDTGVLLATGAVDIENRVPEHPIVAVSYGGGRHMGSLSATYSIAVHERTDVNHRVGTHHYLSQPFFAAVAGMEERLAATIRQHMQLP
jgi:hypothetical protein